MNERQQIQVKTPMRLDGYQAKIEYDAESSPFRREILGLNGSAGFYSMNPSKLRAQFSQSLQVFLAVCQ